MPSPEIRRNVLSASALVLPVILVKLATTFLGHSAATTAQAAPRPASTDPAASTTVVSTKITPRQIAAANYVESLRTASFGRAPMLFQEKPATTGTSETTTNNSTPVQDTRPNEPLPKFTLNAVMSSSTGQRALINGHPYRVGDVIKDTHWTVKAIDVAARSATLSDTQSDRTVVIAVEIPQ